MQVPTATFVSCPSQDATVRITEMDEDGFYHLLEGDRQLAKCVHPIPLRRMAWSWPIKYLRYEFDERQVPQL